MTKKPTKAGTYRAAAVSEFVDFDYLGKLSREELAWLKKFRDEYYYDKLTNPPALHKRKAQRSGLHRLNDERRRDIWNNHNRADQCTSEVPSENDDEQTT